LFEVARLMADEQKLETMIQQLITLETWRLEILPLLLTSNTMQVETPVQQLITFETQKVEGYIRIMQYILHI